MADRVPYSGFSEAAGAQAPRFEPTPEFHVQAPPAAFGTNIGQAVQGLGEVQEGAGKEMFQRALAFQDLTNHATARGASVKTAQEQAQLWADFDAKGGMAAGPEALKKLQQDLDAVRVRNGADLNPMANEYYQNDAASTQSRLYIYSASHSAQALKQFDKETVIGQNNTADLLVQGQPHSDAEIQRAYNLKKSSAILNAHREGYDPNSPQGQTDLIVEYSKTSLAAVKGFAQRGQWEQGQAFLEKAEKNGKIGGQWADEAHRVLEQSQITHGSHDIANKTYDPTKSEAENVKAASDAADKASNGDSRVIDATVSRVVTKTAVDNAIKKQALDKATSVIDRAILELSGKAPRTLDDLKADPEFNQAFGVIESNEERAGQTLTSLNDRVKASVRNDNNLTDERSLVTQRLIGEAHDQPEDFIKEDLWKTNLTMDQRKELLKLQEGIRTSGSSAGFRDRATEQVMGDMRQQIIDAVGARGTAEYNEFRGALQQEFDYAREQGKVIDPKMATDMATKLLQDKVIKTRLGGWWNTSGHAYQPSETEAAAIRKQLGAGLSDDQVQRIYLKKLNDILINKEPANAPGQ